MRIVCALLLIAIIMIGCVSLTQQVRNRWDPMIGKSSYSDVLRFLGPPAAKETLGDGRVVAQWGWVRGIPSTSITFFNPNPYLPTSSTFGGGTETLTERLTLTFSPSGILEYWYWQQF